MTQLAVPLISEPFRVSTARMQGFAGVFAGGAEYNPVFAHVPAMQSMVEATQAASDRPGIHAEHDFVFHRPMAAGQTLVTETRVTGAVCIKPGLLCRVVSVTRAGGEMVTTQVTSVLQRGVATLPEGLNADDVPERPEMEDFAPASEATFRIGPADVAAYAEAARDYAPYTLDAEAAKAMGFPGPVLHGMGTLGYAAQAVIAAFAGGDGTRISKLGVRFARPLVVAGDVDLTVVMERRGDVVLFEARTAGGDVVANRGYAEVAA